MLQDDIFKTCYAPVSALSASEWASGVDKDPILMKYTRDGLVQMSEKESQVVSQQLQEVILSGSYVRCQSFACVSSGEYTSG